MSVKYTKAGAEDFEMLTLGTESVALLEAGEET